MKNIAIYLATKNTFINDIRLVQTIYIYGKVNTQKNTIASLLQGQKKHFLPIFTYFINRYSVYYTKVIIIVGLIDQTHFPKMAVNTIIQGINPFIFPVGHLERKVSKKNISKPTTQRSQMLLA